MSRQVVVQRPTNTFSDCLVDIRGKDCFFQTQHGRSFPLTAESSVLYEGSSISPEELDAGTRADIKVGKGDCVQFCDVKFLVRRVTQLQQFSETVIVFSKRKFVTLLLLKAFGESETTKQRLLLLQSKFTAVRRVGGEGMRAFFTAVGVAFLEHLLLPRVSFDEFREFYGLLHAAGDDCLSRYLDQLWEAKQQNKGNESLDNFHSDQGFNAALQKAFINLLISFAEKNPENELVGICLVIYETAEDMRNALENGNDRIQPVEALVSLVLPVRLKIYNITADEDFEAALDCDEQKQSLVRINLLLRMNTFSLLYTKAQCFAEGFTSSLNVREQLSSTQISDVAYNSLYYVPKKKLELQPVALQEEYQKLLNAVETHLDFQHSLQMLIKSVFCALENKQIRGGTPFFVDELIAKTYEMKASYCRKLPKLREELPVLEWEEKLTLLEKSSSFSSSKLMKQCKKCDQHPSVVFIPACGDSICDICMQKYLAKLLSDFQRILEPNGEPIPQLTCPILTCTSQEILPVSLLQFYLGSQYDEHIRKAETITMTKKCAKCAIVHEERLFYLTNYCGCKVCVYCLIELVVDNNSHCLCNTPLPKEVLDYAAMQRYRCQGCGQEKSLLQDFTPIKCETHILCRKCLEFAMNKADKRCPIEYRKFTEHEVEQAKVYFRRWCLYCNLRFESSELLVPLCCRCIYCWECGKKAAKARHEYQNCFLCATPFTSDVRQQIEEFRQLEQFMHTIRADVHQVQACEICFGPIGRVEKFNLSCLHQFHKQCLKEFASNHLSTDFKTQIKCPKAECKQEIDGAILERDLMTAKEFSKYSERLARISSNIVQCPNCMIEFDFLQDAKAEVEGIHCQACKAFFCRECKKDFTPNHDAKMCRHSAILDNIATLQASSSDQVSQCPGCQTPYQKDDHCDHVKCVKPGCVDWCFKCSCLRAPTMEHHNSWHRPQCPNYTPMPKVDNEPIRPNCPECKRLGKRCNPPPNLKVIGRFDIDEY